MAVKTLFIVLMFYRKKNKLAKDYINEFVDSIIEQVLRCYMHNDVYMRV